MVSKVVFVFFWAQSVPEERSMTDNMMVKSLFIFLGSCGTKSVKGTKYSLYLQVVAEEILRFRSE